MNMHYRVIIEGEDVGKDTSDAGRRRGEFTWTYDVTCRLC